MSGVSRGHVLIAIAVLAVATVAAVLVINLRSESCESWGQRNLQAVVDFRLDHDEAKLLTVYDSKPEGC